MVALITVGLQFMQSYKLIEQVVHYKKLYFETDKILEDHFVDMYSDSIGEVVIVGQEKVHEK